MDAFHLNERMEGDQLDRIGNSGADRRDGTGACLARAYLIIGNFQQRRSKKGKPFGLPSALYVTPETKWGYDFVTGEYSVSPSQSWQEIAAQVKKAYLGTDDAQIQALLGTHWIFYSNRIARNGRKEETRC